jgi:hypothetical protein
LTHWSEVNDAIDLIGGGHDVTVWGWWSCEQDHGEVFMMDQWCVLLISCNWIRGPRQLEG